MIRDRGNIKWTALMLSEHREALKKLKDEEGDQEMPELDPQQLEEFDLLLNRALDQGSELKVTYFIDKKYRQLRGVVEGIFPDRREVLIQISGKPERRLLPVEIIFEIIIIK